MTNNKQQITNNKQLNLDRYIKINQERIRSRVLLHSISFHLESELLTQIQQAQQTGSTLEISPELLTNLRYSALIDGENCLQTGLTFCTYYWQDGSEEALMRSVIATDGDILHQIRSDCLQEPQFCHQITGAHYWLIEQLLRQLRLGTLVNLNPLAWVLSLLTTVPIALTNLEKLLQGDPWMWLIPLVMSSLLKLVWQMLLSWFLPTVSRWFFRRLLSSLLSPNQMEHRMARKVLYQIR
ncbi:MAG: hypothetical protein F6K47_21610 [Symploca sp. SIO2E6]|nr:hypothetical protein [Symploca sp. SIO2E6]